MFLAPAIEWPLETVYPADISAFAEALAALLLAPTFQQFAPAVTAPTMSVALSFAALALRFGWVGWAVAMLVPTALVAPVAALIHGGPTDSFGQFYSYVLLGSAPGYGAMLWLAMRWRCPAALAPQEAPAR